MPARIEIPAIGVDASVVQLDIRGSKPEVPDDFGLVGWYGLTRLPGEIGPAVLAGHVDSRQGPAVFFQLDELTTGDQVTVHAADGTSRTFEVVGAGQYPKVDLPDEVFGFGDGVPELRLITCGGSFDRSVGHYQDNYVVYTRAVP
jgi:LPXTG-site transpeptidase (sortase) family protein